MNSLINVGNADRAVRILVGLALLVFVRLRLHGTPALVFGVFAVMLLATGAFRFCPAYRLFGMSTCPPAPRTR